MMSIRKKEKGFTLIELIIVLVVIGILAAVAMPQFANIQLNAKKNAIKGVVGNVRSALTIAKADNLIEGNNNATDFWPTLVEMQNAQTAANVPNSPLDTVLPDNPLCTVPNNTVSQPGNAMAAQSRTCVGTNGWNYWPSEGIFYSNVLYYDPRANGGAGGTYNTNEY